MTAVLFRSGGVLEGGADLTVLSCSAKGSVNRATRICIEHYRIPLPTVKSLGEIEVFPFPGPGTLTKRIAWAASVLNDSSTPEAISRIGERLGEYVNAQQEVRLIESPLLGTGAGRLEPVEAGKALRKGFRASCKVEATLIIYAYQTSIVSALVAATAQDLTTQGSSHEDERSRVSTEGPRPIGLISHEVILELYAAATTVGLHETRDVLLGGIDAAIVAGLPNASDRGAQLLSDLHVLNRTRSHDGSMPLRTWLMNACALRPAHRESEIFQRILGRFAARGGAAHDAHGNHGI